MADGKRFDPLRGYKFRVTVAGFPGTLGFSKVGGLSMGVAVAKYREGTDLARERVMPAQAEFENLKFERGVTDNVSLIRWMQEVLNLLDEAAQLDDDEFRREVTVELMNRKNQVVRVYVATAAFPVKLMLADLEAKGNDVLIESMELAHEGLTIDTGVSDVGLTES